MSREPARNGFQVSGNCRKTVISFVHESDLAAIAGTRTAGQVLGGTGFKVGHGFVLRVPFMTFYTWNGNCLDGKGVEPDYIAELSREALRVGQDNQLQAGLVTVSNL